MQQSKKSNISEIATEISIGNSGQGSWIRELWRTRNHYKFCRNKVYLPFMTEGTCKQKMEVIAPSRLQNVALPEKYQCVSDAKPTHPYSCLKAQTISSSG